MSQQAAHARLAPSSANGWAYCPDYPNANEGLDEDRREAAEGTVAHHICDLCLQFGWDAWDFVGVTTIYGEFSFTWTEDDAMLLQPRLDRIREWAALEGAVFFSEQRVDCSAWLGEDQFGTFDGGFILPSEGVIVIDDFKWGRYVPVYPVRHLQTVIYALAFWEQVARHLTDIRHFMIIIDQPRNAGGGGVWRVTLDELLEIGEWLKERAEATRQPNPPRIATPAGCRYCLRKKQPPTEQGALTGCLTFDRYMLTTMGEFFDDAHTAERRAYLVEHAKLIEAWLEQVQAQLLADAVDGRPAGGLKAVKGSHGTRDKYSDEGAAKAVLGKLLGDKAFTKKLITPIQAGKLIPSEDYEKLVRPLVIPGERNTILVPEADARPSVSNANVFDDAPPT